MTMAQDGGNISLTHRPPLPPVNTPGTHFYKEVKRMLKCRNELEKVGRGWT